MKLYKIKDNLARRFSLLLLKRNKVVVGEQFAVHGLLKIMNAGKISMGDRVTINSGMYFNPVGGANRTVLATESGASIHIGNHCGISHSLLYAAEGITIEDNVLIGGGCSICDTDFHPIDYEIRMTYGRKMKKSKPILIKEGAFIGMNSIILKGVTIGKHSIVGAGSVVTKDVPDNEIWAGNPARFVKSLEHDPGC